MMKNILYYMHIDWRWIKQRPHFLAEGLSDFFYVDVIHEIIYGSNKKQKGEKNTLKNMTLTAMPHIPFCRYDFIFKINAFITNRIILRNKIKKADVIWFGNPIQYKYIKRREGQMLVYDCMDDLLGFPLTDTVRKRFIKYETELCKDADIVFASSLDLKRKLAERYGRSDVHLLNNAISLKLADNADSQELPADVFFDRRIETKKMVYIGTISAWFDFKSVISAIDEHANTELLLFGPKDVEIPEHDRITYCGIAEHKHLMKIMNRADALVMPFILNDLIMSVDPVKAYEYIYAGKPIIMPKYSESEKFGDYVYLYSGADEFKAVVGKLGRGELPTKKSKIECEQYAKSNNWGERVKKIHALLK